MSTLDPLVLGDAFVDVTTTRSLSVGKNYLVQVKPGGVALLHDQDSTSAPSDKNAGHPIWPGSEKRPPDSYLYKCATNSYLFARSLEGNSTLIISESR